MLQSLGQAMNIKIAGTMMDYNPGAIKEKFHRAEVRQRAFRRMINKKMQEYLPKELESMPGVRFVIEEHLTQPQCSWNY